MQSDHALIGHFESFLRYRGLSAHTLRAYCSDVERFSTYLGSIGSNLSRATEKDVRGYVAMRTREGRSPSTINRERAAVTTLFVCMRLGAVVKDDPGRRVQKQNERRGLPEVLTQEELRRLLAVRGDDFYALRDRALFETLYSTAALVSEVVAADVGRLESDGTLWVPSRSGIYRPVFLGATARRALMEYLPLRRARLERFARKHRRRLADAEAALFLDGRTHRLTERGARLLVAERARDVLFRRANPRILRNTAAVDLCNRGIELAALTQILGLVKATNAERYVWTAGELLRQAYTAHPHAETRERQDLGEAVADAVG